MLVVNGISKSFDHKQILDNITFSLGKNEVVGLVGKNGSGKTTIFKIIMDKIIPDQGNIQKSGEIIGYLPQFPDFGDMTVAQFLNSNLPNHKIDQIFNNLGLANIDKAQKASDLSGGQKTRLYLASLLLSDPKPSILILDEPTNNLDLEGLKWLEIFVSQFKGSILLTSHDRAFLDDTADRIIELDGGKVKNYGGNYSFYKEQKLIEEKTALEKYKENIEKIKRLEKLIIEKRERIKMISHDKGKTHEKFEAAFFRERTTKKASSSQNAFASRLKKLGTIEKFKERISYPFGFEGQIHGDKFIIGVKNISKHYEDKQILDNISFAIFGNQYIWLSGTNGCGKTTLLKILSGILEPDNGKVEIGNNIKIGYFSQEASQLDINKTGIEELKMTGIPEADCFKFAMNLHLSPKDLRKTISQLSRGQIAKLEFIKLLIGQNHLLILDEPTNHLEIETREEIEEALKNYQGSILIVSHDRYFLEEIGINKVFEIKNGKLQEFLF